MTATYQPFVARRVHQGVEILPHADAWRTHHDTSPMFYALLAVVIFAWSPNTPTLAGAGLFAGFGLFSTLINRRIRKMNSVPLVVGDDRSITYGGETVDAGDEPCHVRVVRREAFEEPDTYGVELFRRKGRQVVMPNPYFDYLSPTDAAVLAVELAKALETTVVRGAIRVSRAPTLSIRPKTKAA
jgi:hypothetical protein